MGSTIMLLPAPMGGAWSAAATYIVFSMRPRRGEHAPVRLLQRTAHPLGGHAHDVGAGVDDAPGHLGEPGVVAGLQTESDACGLEDLGRGDVARRHPFRLALPERVVQVQLAVAGDDAFAGRECDDGVVHPALAGVHAFDQARDEMDVDAVGERGEVPA